MAKIKHILLACLLALASCANPQPPDGGPKDSVPPAVQEFSPAQNTLNFKGDEVVIKFSEYVQKLQIQENVIVSPNTEVNFDWSGREMTLEFPEPLLENTTYSVFIGTGYNDLHNNPPATAFTMVFSTGPDIDSCMISGQLYDKDPNGKFIYAFKIDDLDPDTLDPANNKPDYITQTGSSGEFSFSALKPGQYRLMSTTDEFKDRIYGSGSDAFCAAPRDVETVPGQTPGVNIKSGPMIDKMAPMLFRAEALFDRVIIAGFSEEIDSTTVKPEEIIISDSASTLSISALAAWFDNGTDILVSPARALSPDTLWKIGFASSVSDTSGNTLPDSARSALFMGIADADTLILDIEKISVTDSSNSHMPTKPLEIAFTNAAIMSPESITFTKASDFEIEYEIKRKDSRHYMLAPKSGFESAEWYRIAFDMNNIDCPTGATKKDTIINITFQTADIRNYGGASGIFEASGNLAEYVLLLSSDKNNFSTRVKPDGKWNFPSLPEGTYFVEVFHDRNNNGKYDYGFDFPFEHSEPFRVIKEPIEVKSRWTVDEILIRFDE